MKFRVVLLPTTTVMLLLFSVSASANRLEVDPDVSWVLHIGSLALLYAHIGGGILGLASGGLASLSKKGSTLHRAAGKVFFISMCVCYLIGALVSPFLESQQSTNFVASILALYLLITGVNAARRKQFTAGKTEWFGLLIAVLITVLGATFMLIANSSPEGSFDGSPPQAYILFIVTGGLAAIGEVNVLLRKHLSTNARITRHLWRMCLSFFIASGSLFFGQMQLFPNWFLESILPILLGFFPVMVLIVYLVKFTLQRLISYQRKALD